MTIKPFKTVSVLFVALMVCIVSPAQDKCVLDHSRPITLEGGQYKPTRFGNSKRDFHLKGNFTAHGNKISVYITDAENFARLINGQKFIPFHAQKKVTEGKFDLLCSKGNYHLVWWNESRDKSVVIEVDLCFVYPDNENPKSL